MRHPTYSEYKESGIQWLGDIPIDWNVKPIKYVSLINSNVLNENTDRDYEFEYIDISSVTAGIGIQKTEKLRFSSAPSSARRLVKNGDIIVSTVRAYLRAMALIKEYAEKYVVSTGFCVVTPIDNLNPDYCSYMLQSPYFVETVVAGSTGVCYPTTNASDIANIDVCLPTYEEQKKIATFLDKETQKIDRLIEKQQQLIKLLQEKRQAVISHAVTKGLNLDAPMRDSGVEWLGEVPERWEIRAVSKLSNKITNGYVGPTRDILVPEGVPYIQATHIKKGKVNFDNAYFVRQSWSDAHAKSILVKGDVLIVQTGAGTGDIGLVTEHEAGFNCHALIIIQSDKKVISGDYLSMVFQSQYGYSVLYSIRTGGMHPHLNCGEVQYVKLPVPPLDEQIAINGELKVKVDVLQKLMDKATLGIKLLKERRTSLISAAVTGKIDVRSTV